MMSVKNVTRSRGSRALVVALAVVAATSTAAWAQTGSTANDRSVRFYYGETSGHGDSQDFTGSGNVNMCTNSDGGSNQTYVAQYLKNRSFQPDDVIRDSNRSYNSGLYKSSSFSISTNNKYHTTATWSAVPAAPNGYSGYVSTHYLSSSPCD